MSRSARPPASPVRVYISGYYGVPNFGDELILWTLVALLKERLGVSTPFVSVLNPSISRAYSNCRIEEIAGFIVSRRFLQTLPRRLKAIHGSQLVVIGGGGLFGDYYTRLSPFPYISDALLAVVLDTPFVVVGVGAPGFVNPVGRAASAYALRRAIQIVARDHESQVELEALTGQTVGVAPDIGHIGAHRMNALTTVVRRSSRSYAVVNVRRDPAPDRTALTSLLESLVDRFGHVVLLGVVPQDRDFLDCVRDQLPMSTSGSVQVHVPITSAQVWEVLGGASLVVAERLHVNLAAIHLGCQLVSIVYEGKVGAMLDDTSQPISTRVGLDLDGFDRAIDAAGRHAKRRRNLDRMASEAESFYVRVLADGLKSQQRASFKRRLGAGGAFILVTGFATTYRAFRLALRLVN